jgi:AcrR family transcriptional regulator
MTTPTKSGKRPYELGKRLEQMDENRAAVLRAARELVAGQGYRRFTMESLAARSGVTRQTIHNLFGTKAGVLGALFDLLALEGGMEGMAQVMSSPTGEGLIDGFVVIFCRFWARERPLLRQVHAIAVIDPEFGALIEERNRRRLGAATHIVSRLAGMPGGMAGVPGGVRAQRLDAALLAQQAVILTALTSFELFDRLAELLGSDSEATAQVCSLVKKAMA